MTQRSHVSHYYIWTIAFTLMAMIPWIGIPYDLFNGVSNGMGTVLNMGAIFPLVFFILLGGALRTLQAPRERRALGAAAIFILLINILGFDSPGHIALIIGGLLAIFGAIAAAASTYALQRDGFNPGRVILLATALGALPVISEPALMAIEMIRSNDKIWFLEVPGFTNIRAMGYFAASGIIALSAWRIQITLLRGATHAVALSLLWSALFWSGSRAGLIAVMAGLLIMNWPGIGKLRRYGETFAVAAIGAALSLLYVHPSHHFGMFSRMEEVGTQLASGGVDSVSSGRIDLWTWSIERILEHPIFGWGYAALHQIPGAPRFYHAHNVILDYAMGFGIPLALFALATLLALSGLALTRFAKDHDTIQRGLIGLVVTLPIYSMFSAVLINPWPLTLYLCALATALTRPRPVSKAAPDGDGLRPDSSLILSSIRPPAG